MKKPNSAQEEEQAWLACMRAAFSAGEACALKHFRRQEQRGDLAVHAKEDDSPATIADRETEAALLHVVKSFYPHDSLWGEESGKNISDSDKGLWIVDPIDGTKGFIAGLPLFGILLARLDTTGQPLGQPLGQPWGQPWGQPRVCGMSMPALGCRRFFATSRSSSWEEDAQGQKQRNLATSDCERLDKARLFVGEAEKTLHYDSVQRLEKSVRTCRFEHDCYMYVRLAAGGVDIVIEAGLQPYDFMPLLLIITQAGGVVSDWQGKPLTAESKGEVVASANARLHRQVLACIESSQV